MDNQSTAAGHVNTALGDLYESLSDEAKAVMLEVFSGKDDE